MNTPLRTAVAKQAGMAVEVRELRKEFPTRAEPLVVLDGLGLQLAAGEALSIVGPSGCGKSTLLHIMGTLDRPTSGRVALGGADPFDLTESDLARFRNRRIGFVFQDHHLLSSLNVLENVLMPSLAWDDPFELGGETLPDRAHRLIERVGLADRSSHLPAELSGGERQRAAMARALLLRPSLLLCDEPTGNLDPRTAHSVGELLFEINREEGCTLVAVTHSAELAASFGVRAEMKDGRLEMARS